MGMWQDIKLRFAKLNSLEKIIAINVVFFMLPFILTTVFYLFKISISGSDLAEKPDLQCPSGQVHNGAFSRELIFSHYKKV